MMQRKIQEEKGFPEVFFLNLIFTKKWMVDIHVQEKMTNKQAQLVLLNKLLNKVFAVFNFLLEIYE